MSHDDDLPALRAPAPKRSDDAFARAVLDDVTRRRQTAMKPAIVGGAAAALALFVAIGAPSTTPVDDRAFFVDSESLAALVQTEDIENDDDVDNLDAVDDLDDDALLAFAGAADPGFAFAELDGSSDAELHDVENALDRALDGRTL